MIIAWGIFLFSILGIILAFAIDKKDVPEYFTVRESYEIFVIYLMALCSAQYIFG